MNIGSGYYFSQNCVTIQDGLDSLNNALAQVDSDLYHLNALTADNLGYTEIGNNKRVILDNTSHKLYVNAGVTGVKGNSESSYRTGQANLTAANIGALALRPTSIEFQPSSASANNGGFIDFHYNQPTSYYTSRIIESASGTLKFYGKIEQGSNTPATGTNSHAEGYYTVASGTASHAECGGPARTSDGNYTN
jgi:hypothetical protein